MNLPASLAPLAQCHRWLHWKLIHDPERPSKPRKVPINPRTGVACNPTDPAAWCTYQEAVDLAARTGLALAYVFHEGDGYFFLDIDNCRQADGNWTQLALSLVSAFQGHAACEVSQSGNGLHIFGWASQIPDHACRNIPLGLELYHTGRFVALTAAGTSGFIDADTSAQLAAVVASFFPKTSATRDVTDWTDTGQGSEGATEDDEELIRIMLASGKKTAAATFNPDHVCFEDLWTADEEKLAKKWPSQGGDCAYDRSAADSALAALIAYWTAKNCERTERLMRRSALAREKWDSRPDYMERTILGACATVRNVAKPRELQQALTVGPAENHNLGVVASASDAEISEDRIAEAFTNHYAGSMKFDHNRGKWFVYDDRQHWVLDEKRGAFHRARMACRALGQGKRLLGKASTAEGVEKLLRADPAFSVTSDAWDSDPMLLGVPGGTVDLRSGEVRPARREDMITRIASVAPESATPTLWLQVLAQLFPGDPELVAFLKRFFGYVLTGSVREHALLFFLGPGGNGKSTVLNVMTRILADYATTATVETFMATAQDRHSTDLAMLKGARLVTASETESGRYWAEARLKALTGGDPISARFMRQDNFTFLPQFKLLIAGNHPPRLRNTDEAMRRRLFIVPFRVKPTTPDPKLDERLRLELPRILAWCIEGCLEWQRDGLNAPESVRLASLEYFETQDIFGQWLAEKCDIGPAVRALPTPLFQSWVSFAHAVNTHPGDQRAFAGQLRARGFGEQLSSGQKFWTGLALKVAGPSAV